MADTARPPDWDPNQFKTVDDRAAEYARMREQCPVALGMDAWGAPSFWSVMRHRDIVTCARDSRTFANGASARLGIRRMPLESDPPEHGQIRRLLNPFFLPRALERRAAVIRAAVQEHLEPFVAAGGGDAVRAIARPIPTKVVMAFLGQPLEDWSKIKDWADASRPQQVTDEAARKRIEAAEQALWDYSWALVRDRQASPRPADEDPVTAILNGTINGKPMPEEHAVGMVRLVLAAGHDSTSQAFGIVTHFLATRPDVWAMLSADRTLIRPAIEETLRLNSPVVAMPRTVTTDIELGDRQIRAGDRVLLNWASANRDPDVFDDADVWRLDRPRNPHMVFGHGIHTCAGAPLARQELELYLNRLIDLCYGLEMVGDPTIQQMQQYGFAALPVRIRRA
jgi:cytochrome P450